MLLKNKPENRATLAQEAARHFGPLLPSCGEYAKLQSVFLGPFQVGQEQSGFNHKKPLASCQRETRQTEAKATFVTAL